MSCSDPLTDHTPDYAAAYLYNTVELMLEIIHIHISINDQAIAVNENTEIFPDAILPNAPLLSLYYKTLKKIFK